MKMFNNRIMSKYMKGLTLVELVVVIAVVGLLTSVTLALVNPAQQLAKARDTKRKADLAQIQAALELYRADQNSYPSSLPACGGTLSNSGTTYLRDVPCDPKNSGQLIYRYLPVGATPVSYQLIVCLENSTDPDIDSPNNTTYCSGSNRSYTVVNP